MHSPVFRQLPPPSTRCIPFCIFDCITGVGGNPGHSGEWTRVQANNTNYQTRNGSAQDMGQVGGYESRHACVGPSWRPSHIYIDIYALGGECVCVWVGVWLGVNHGQCRCLLVFVFCCLFV